MDKNRLKSFAVESRRILMRNVSERLNVLGFGEKKIEKPLELGNEVEINGIRIERNQYEGLKDKYGLLGYQELVEEMAYTWFNRFTALRFMELNGYIDEAVTESTTSKIEPGIVDMYSEASYYDELTQDQKMEIHTLRDSEKLEELYVKLVEYKCDELNRIMPFMFEKTGDYTELLFPMGLLREGSFLIKLREAITKENREENSEGEKVLPVEIIGWLYQYYITENNELVYDGSMKKSKIPKELLPAATQLFTPKWVVKYMVENSLGKLALESLGVDNSIKDKWKYYIETENNGEINRNSERLNIEEIKILDPAMGSGHMLVYAFDVLYQIYDQLGYSSKDAVMSILKNNLYGLEIDDRAGQLAGFALMMKGRERYRRLFRTLKRKNIVLNIIAIQESNSISENTRNIIEDNKLNEIKYLIDIFQDAKEYGSILKLKKIGFEKFDEEKKILQSRDGLFYQGYKDILETLIKQALVMIEKYDITITNPPYLGSSRMNDKLSGYVKKNYPDVKSDFSMIFYEKSIDDFTKKNGFISFITTNSWMFLKSFEKIRVRSLRELEFESLVDFGSELFDGKVGHNLIVAWINKNIKPTKKLKAIKLTEFRYSRRNEKELEFFNNRNYYIADQKYFKNIKGSPISYWASNKILDCFKERLIGDIFPVKKGLDTGENDKYLRFWQEINFEKFGLNLNNGEQLILLNKKWVPYNKGGEFQKWYGNKEYLINWENNGLELKNSKANLRSQHLYFKKGITWNALTSSKTSARLSDYGALFDSAGSSMFPEELNYYLSFMNSKIVDCFLQSINPTLNYGSGTIAKLPDKKVNRDIKIIIKNLTQYCIDIAKQEWDSRETSWDFTASPLIYIEQRRENNEKIVDAYDNYCHHWREQFVQMHKNEEELNRLFIEIYGLEEEMDSYVDFNDITLLKKEKEIIPIEIPSSTKEERAERDKTAEGYLYNRGVLLEFDREEIIKQFISYGMGCIMGRYSLDKPGLIMANSDDQLTIDHGQFTIKGFDGETRHEIENSRFFPDEDGIIPIVSDEYFGDDVVERFVEFVKAAYGDKNLEENLNFIAQALGKKSSESVVECIRKYFVKEFMNDHIQKYKYDKRPIYWLMDSGKKDGFKALIYLHRYHPLTVGAVRTDYLLKYQEILEGKKVLTEKQLLEEITPKEKKELEKELKTLDEKLDEIRKYDSLVKHYAEKRVDLDLDDGVKVNYGKLREILYKISGL